MLTEGGLLDTARRREASRLKRDAIGVDLDVWEGVLCWEAAATQFGASVRRLWMGTFGDDQLNDLAETLCPVKEDVAGGI